MIDRRLNIYAPSGNDQKSGRFELMGSLSTALTQAHGRLIIVRVCFVFAYLMVAIRAFDLMILQGSLIGYNDHGNTETALSSTVSSPRRDIVDRNGVLLATSIKTVSLYADPELMIDPEKTAKGLGSIFTEMNDGDLLQKIQSDKRFVWIKRNLTPNEQAAVLELGQPGLAFQEEYRRIYPQGPLAAHIVGYSGVDSQGLSSIEQGFNDILKKDGDAMALTIDIRLQHVLRREVATTIKDFTAKAGAGLIMDIKSGDVLGAVSLPDFDPHQPNLAKDDEKFNRFSLGTYELGSTFKIFTTAALLEQQNTPMSTAYDTRNPIKVGRFTISDYHPENRVQTIPEVFMHSSNIGTAMMAQQIGTAGLKNFFDDLGLFKPLDFDLPEVGRPQLPHPWREVSTLTTSYGHGMAITPLQLAAATATIIGDGTAVAPHLLMNETPKTKTGIRVVSPETSEKMRELLRLVVRHGTGSKADVTGLMVGGKTGTAEKSINGRYIHNALISSFIGAFPMNDPQYLVMIMIDDPKPNKSSYGFATAGWTAAPTAARVISGMANIYGLVPNTDLPDKATPLEQYLADYKPASLTTPLTTPLIPLETGASLASFASVPE